MLRVLLAGGGTAGHINPAISIAEIIKEEHPDAVFLFAGNPNGMEAKLLPKAGYNFAPIKVSGFQRKINVKNIGRNVKACSYLAMAGQRAKQIIKEFKPDLVVGTGGYVSGPVVLKAAKMGIKTVIHEQNAFPGVTTKLLSKHVDVVMLTVESAKKYFKDNVRFEVTGIPIRKGFSTMDKEVAKSEINFPQGVTILSSGGSLGAGAINQTVSDLIIYTQKNNLDINHIHSYGGMGENTFEKKLTDNGVKLEGNKRLKVQKYIDNMPTCMAAADIVISRCGASSIAELQCAGRGSILIPSPIVAENHQYHNGLVLEKAGAGILIEQKDLTSEMLIEKVMELYNNKDKLEKLSENARKLHIKDTNQRIYKVISKLIKDK